MKISDNYLNRRQALWQMLVGAGVVILDGCRVNKKRAPAVEAKLFTPLKALQAALAEPLSFVGRGSGETIGYGADFALWRNSKVLVRTDYLGDCSETKGNEVIGIYIYSPHREVVSIYAEVEDNQSVYNAKSGDYTEFEVKYSDYSAIAPGIPLNMLSVQDYIQLEELRQKKLSESFDKREMAPPICYGVICEGMDPAKRKAWEEAMTKFLKNLPQEWYKFVKLVEALHRKYGFIK